MAVVASSRGCSLATQCTWRAETAVSPGTTRRSRASSAAARNGERALPPGTVVSTRSCDEAMGAVSRSWSGADAVAKVTGAGAGPRAPPGRRARPGRRGSCHPPVEICTVWNMIDVTRESTAPVDRLWSTISDVRALAAVAPHGGCRHPPRPGPRRRGGRVLHGRAARAADSRLDDHRLGGGPLLHLGVAPGRASARSAPTPCGRAPTDSTTIELGITWRGRWHRWCGCCWAARASTTSPARPRPSTRTAGAADDAGEDATDDAASA